jgi:hypothetical protein
MKHLLRLSARLSAAAFMVAGLVASPVSAQESLAKQLQGHWVLATQYVDQDGKKVEPFGANPRGSLIMTPDGRFSLFLMRASIPKFASNSRIKGTAAENEAVVHSSIAYYGGYKVADERTNTVELHIEGSTFPNWDGEIQKRTMVINGNELRLTNPVAGIGGVAHIVWRRGK